MSAFFTTLLAISIFNATVYAYTLQDNIVETLRTNPVVQERLKNFRATQQDLNIAKSEYYPSLDLRASVGYNKAGDLKDSGDSDFDHTVNPAEYKNYETSLVYSHNLFRGLSTNRKVDFEQARILAAAYNYLEKANDIALKMTNAYIDVMKSAELVQTSRENVEINENILKKVQALFEAGLTTDSEVKKIQSTLSLARSNLIVQQNNARDSQYKYRRILGRLPEVDYMQKPLLDVKMPESIERAALYAVENNPSLIVSKYNIEGARALRLQKNQGYFPSLDLEISQTFNDHDQLANGFDQADDRFKAKLIFTYNLFRGMADDADAQKHISKLSQELDIYRDLKRQVIEGLDLSWTAYEMIGKQLIDLREFSKYSEKTLELNKEEYDLGRRSLLDLLSAQNDVINSRSQIIKAEYDHLLAKYRVLDAMGLLVVAVNGSTDEFLSKVNLTQKDDVDEVLDTLDEELDVDHDNITDNIDLCDNSLQENNIMPYGCKNIRMDEDKDGVLDAFDECPHTKIGAKVEKNGCAIFVEVEQEDFDEDLKFDDGLNNEVKEEILESDDGLSFKVDQNAPEEFSQMKVFFEKNSANLPDDLEEKVLHVSQYIKENPDVKVSVVGYTSKTDVSNYEYNLKLSQKRANAVQGLLLKQGVTEDRLVSIGKAFSDPISHNLTEESRAKNRRVEIKLLKKKTEEL